MDNTISNIVIDSIKPVIDSVVDVNLTAGLDYNTASLEANMYNLRTWSGLHQFFSTKIFQFAYYPYLGQLLVIVTLIGWLLLAVVLWADRFCRSASRESWVGKLREQLLQQLAVSGVAHS
ncbi:hypothetical protein [Pleurocapsa sp. PCC 7319]|uniref:hypothetical protein n=1 Tax=Pleurocapsa sp. PCC 7319 TaxID=118161 RepID=UPI00034B97BE|nr:hypothetical protein [Pleurocapsa sp. PCC 7319]